MKLIKTFLLFATLIGVSFTAQSFENPFKPGRVRVEIADQKINLTRSTSCRKSRHKGWRQEHSCVCCLLKRGVRKNHFKVQGESAFKYCIEKKKYCTETDVALLARRYGMKYTRTGFDYKTLHKRIYQAHGVNIKPSFYDNVFRNLFNKYRRRDQYPGGPSGPQPFRARPDNATFAEEQAARANAEREEQALSPEDRAAYASGNPGTVEVILYKQNAALFGRLFKPVEIGGVQYLYIVAKYDKVGPELRERRYLVFPNINKSKVGRVPGILLKSLVDGNDIVEGTTIRATPANTIMPLFNAE